MIYIFGKQTFFLWSYCVLSRGAPPHPPTPQNPPKGPPSSCIHNSIPRRSLCFHPPAHAVNPSIPAPHPGCKLHPAPFPPPLPICTLLRIIFPFNLPPSKRERDIQHVQVKGGGRGSKADTSLFLVSADHMRGSNKLKNG